MGKKVLRKKRRSNGIHSSVAKATIRLVREGRSFADKFDAKFKAWCNGANPWITVDSGQEKSNTRFTRVRMNDLYGGPRRAKQVAPN
jgi:hypothetical protein